MLSHSFLYTPLLGIAALLTLLFVWLKRDELGLWIEVEEKLPETRYFVLPDQRQMAYGIYGAPNAASTVFYFHGCPSSHHEAFLLSDAGRRYGVRIVAPSRPGSGGSTFRDKGAILDYPDDVLALADYLNITKFGIIAVSGGAPYAFACRQRIPRPRLTGMGIVAGIYPVTSLGTAGMKLPSRIMLRVATWFPGVVAWLIDRQLGTVARDKDEGKMEALLVADMQQDSTPQSDRLAWEAARPAIRKAVVMGVREGVRYGGQGPAWEMKSLGSHWGFELADVQPKGDNELVMWHGNLDANVSIIMAEKATAQLGPHAELRRISGQGHGTLTFHMADDIVKTLRAMLDKN
ncbi:Alpha/Beta hydrolase protein [Chaetomium tenue]|uniref:Alpha/Beta hydrolase protein n=1 Tax=Chaetomium tenue TaxID=1854479 RepID=A0ACB7PQA5_9PEZI|nr:Alpha/Beta hydrolase protein [Chaetomium globosum]